MRCGHWILTSFPQCIPRGGLSINLADRNLAALRIIGPFLAIEILSFSPGPLGRFAPPGNPNEYQPSYALLRSTLYLLQVTTERKTVVRPDRKPAPNCIIHPARSAPMPDIRSCQYSRPATRADVHRIGRKSKIRSPSQDASVARTGPPGCWAATLQVRQPFPPRSPRWFDPFAASAGDSELRASEPMTD
jgi:hypothetical protein